MPNVRTERPVVMYRWQRVLHEHPKLIDAAIAAALVTLSFPGVVLGVDGQRVPADARLPGWLLMGLACAALMWHRRQPRISAIVTMGCTVAMTALGFVLTPLLLAPLMVALFMVAARVGQRTGYAYTGVAIVVVAATALMNGQTDESFELSVFGPSLWLLLPAVLGGEVRLRLAYTDAVRARAEYAERTRDEEARHRVGEERMRIARELHDVVAHHLALANAQATTVAHLMDREPGKAKTMANDLSRTITSALRELKSTVGLFRQTDDLAGAALEPAPGLAQLPGLVASFGAAGLAVTVTTDGDPRPLSPGVDLASYRIIQEALTNVAKHAPASTAQVRLTYAADRLHVNVTNDFSAQTAPVGDGYGLIGMRERALSLGGRFHAGPRPTGGFEVDAELPLQPRPDPDPSA